MNRFKQLLKKYPKQTLVLSIRRKEVMIDYMTDGSIVFHNGTCKSIEAAIRQAAMKVDEKLSA